MFIILIARESLTARVTCPQCSGVANRGAPEFRGRRFHDIVSAAAWPCRLGAVALSTCLLLLTGTRGDLAATTASPDPTPVVADDESQLVLRTWIGERKPDFALPDLTGVHRTLADQAGRPVLVHFFATWCEPCRPELQALERLAARERTVRVIAISVDEPDGRVRRFFEATPVSFPVLLDRDRATAKSWGVDILPTSFLLDAELNPRLFVERDLAWDRVDMTQVRASLAARDRASAADSASTEPTTPPRRETP
jgi:peroxiredoxin